MPYGLLLACEPQSSKDARMGALSTGSAQVSALLLLQWLRCFRPWVRAGTLVHSFSKRVRHSSIAFSRSFSQRSREMGTHSASLCIRPGGTSSVMPSRFPKLDNIDLRKSPFTIKKRYSYLLGSGRIGDITQLCLGKSWPMWTPTD